MANRVLSVLSAAAVLVAGFPGVAAGSGEGRVRTGDGWLQGTVTARQVSFEGIPYAAPPVRWRAPRPVEPWQGVRAATQPGQPCAQLGTDDAGQTQVVGGEDCLFLNVTTPRSSAGPLPVLVFVHGGGLVNGSGAPHDPGRVVEQGAVVVTVNYRLGALGFLRHPSLRDPYAGNFGLADQQAALRWVRRNIAAFGGDRHNVTLWGQSAGGAAVCAQLAAPGARGLFDKAIVQSAPCGNAVLDRSTATDRGLGFAAEVGCAVPDAERCLRDTPVASLVRQVDHDRTFQVLHRRSTGKPWMPVAGTSAVPQQPLTALRQGTAADVPFIHGGTRDEMRALVGPLYDFNGTPLSVEEYPKVVRELFGDDAGRVLEVYPVGAYATPSIALATLLTDYGAMIGACTQLPALDAATRGAPVYAYEYAQPTSLPPVGAFPLGAFHGADLDNFLDHLRPPPNTPEEKAFAARLIGHWVTFARTGAPGPTWPSYRRGTATALSLTIDRTTPVNLADEHHCGFWRTVA